MILIKNGRVIDPKTNMDQIADIIIEDNKIKYIGKEAAGDFEEVIDATGKVVAPGLVDVHVHFREPGQTHKEDLATGSAAAAAGGFTSVVCMANTNPVVDNVETLNYILNKAKKLPIHVHQTCSISIGLHGANLVDMETLKNAGAAGFTDDGVSVMDAALLKKAMQKAKELNLPISLHEEDAGLIAKSGVHQGKISEQLNFGGAPSLAEDTMVARDAMIALETGASITIQHISSANAVNIIRFAKKFGADVIAEATPHHFTLTEEDVLKHGTLCKMNPPVRTKEDKEAIIEALKNDTIEIIATDHAPHSDDEKNQDLASAPSGIIGLETSLGLGISQLVDKGHLSLMKLLEKMTKNPAQLYRLDAGYLAEDGPADIVIFDENEEWVVDKFASKASNSPFVGMTLKGKVKYTICDGKVVYKD